MAGSTTAMQSQPHDLLACSIKRVPKFTSPFAPLQLSDADQRVLRHTTYALIAEAVDEYDRFVQRYGNSAPPKTQWRQLQQQDDVRMFVQHDKQRMPVSARGTALSTLLAVGTVDGSIADNLYAVSSLDIARERVREAHCKTLHTNMAVLAVLETPSVAAPFRSMSIRWGVKEMPPILHVALKHEDSVTIVATGMTTSRSGERMGYRIVHSIELPGITPVKEYTRVDVSTVTLWRAATTSTNQNQNQRQQGLRSHVFLKTFADLKTTLTPAALRVLADQLMSVTRNAQVTRMHKLTRMLRTNAQNQHQHRCPQPIEEQTHCVACSTNFDHLFAPTKHACRLCRLSLCTSCSIKRTVHAVNSQSQVRAYHVRVCPRCWDVVRCTDTEQFALDEVLAASDQPRRRIRSEFLSLSADDDSIHSTESTGQDY